MAIEFKKFPKMVYDMPNSKPELGEYSFVIVNNEEELEAAKASGYGDLYAPPPEISKQYTDGVVAAKKGRK